MIDVRHALGGRHGTGAAGTTAATSLSTRAVGRSASGCAAARHTTLASGRSRHPGHPATCGAGHAAALSAWHAATACGCKDWHDGRHVHRHRDRRTAVRSASGLTVRISCGASSTASLPTLLSLAALSVGAGSARGAPGARC